MAAETELERLVVRLTADVNQYLGGIQQAQQATSRAMPVMQREVRQVSQELKRSGDQAVVFGEIVDNLGTKMSNVAGQFRAMAAIESPWGFVREAVTLAGQAERTQVDFGTMLQSMEKGQDLTRALVKFSAETPLNMPDIKQGAKTLLQFGESAESVIPTLRMIGDVALGDAEKVRRMVLAFGQVRGVGRVQGDELNQMIEAGFNPLREMARTRSAASGRPMEEELAALMKMKEQGKVTFDMLKEAFRTATSEGGQFNEGMKKASETFEGLASTAGDDIGAFKTAVGEAIVEQFRLKGALKEVSEIAKEMTTTFKAMPDWMKLTAAGLVAVVAAGGALVLVWKVGAIASGMVVGVLRDMWVTKKALTAATWEYVAALRAQGTVQTADAMGMGMTASTHRGARATIVGGQVLTMVAIVHGAKMAIDAIRGVNDEIARMNGLLGDAHKASVDAMSEFRAGRSKAAEGQGTAGLKAMIDSTEKSIAGLRGSVKSAEQAMEDAKPSAAARILSLGTIGNEDYDAFRLARAEAERLKAALENQVSVLGDLRKRLEEVQKARGGDPKAMADAGAFLDKLELEAATHGMAKHAAEAHKIALRGLSEEMRATIEYEADLADQIDAARKAHDEATKAAEKHQHSVGEFLTKLDDEIKFFGMDSEQIHLNKLAREGLGVVQQEAAQQAIEEINRLKELKRLREDAARVTEQFRTPQQRFNDEQARLNDLLDRGLISQETFTAAIAHAREQLNGTTREAHGLNQEMRRFDAVAFGSAEARRRIEAFREVVGGASSAIHRASIFSNVSRGSSGSDRAVIILDRIHREIEKGNRKPVIQVNNVTL